MSPSTLHVSSGTAASPSSSSEEKTSLEDGMDKWFASLKGLPKTLRSKKYQCLIAASLSGMLFASIVGICFTEVVKAKFAQVTDGSKSPVAAAMSATQPVQAAVASAAPVVDSRLALFDPVSSPATPTPAPAQTSTAQPRNPDGSAEPTTPSPRRQIASPQAAVQDTLSLHGVKGRWRSPEDVDCHRAIQIDVRDGRLLWQTPRPGEFGTNGQLGEPLSFSILKADTSEISAQAPNEAIATFDVHTHSMDYMAENLEKPVHYVKCQELVGQ